MDGFMYYGVLIVIGIVAFTLNQNNSPLLALIAIVIGIYIVYSHETGNTATNFKNEMVDSLKENTDGFSKSYNVQE